MNKVQLFSLVSAAVLSTSAMAAQQYTTTFAPMNAEVSSNYLGKVGVAVPVTVLKTQGDKSQVRVEGWALAEYPSQLFIAPGQRIELASFDEEKAVKLDPKAGEKEVQGNIWVRASAEGWIETKSLTSDINGLWAQGKARLGQACSSCHGAPQANHFTANQWASQLPERGGRAGHTRAGSNALMFKYLQMHAKQ